MIKRALLVIALVALLIAVFIPSYTIHTGLPTDFKDLNGTYDLSTIESTKLFAFIAIVMISAVLTISFMQLMSPC